MTEWIRNREFTKYTDIFKGSYWGCGGRSRHGGSGAQEVIEGRNAFVENYKIKQYCSPTVQKKMNKIICKLLNIEYICKSSVLDLDHSEYYENKKGELFFVISPYHNNHKNELINYGFEFYGESNFYEGAYTYILNISEIHHPGIIYLIQPAEHIGTMKYKVGMSNSPTLNRVKQGYKSGTRYLIIMENETPVETEKQILRFFNSKYELVEGRETFEGVEKDIKEDFLKLIL